MEKPEAAIKFEEFLMNYEEFLTRQEDVDNAREFLEYLWELEDNYVFLRNIVQATHLDLQDMSEDYGVERFGEWSEKLKDLIEPYV